MKTSLILILFWCSSLPASPPFAAGAGPSPSVILNLEKTPQAKLHNVPVSAVTIQDGFWAARRKINIERSIPTLLDQLEQHGVVDNFRRLSGRKDVKRRGPLYTDSDLYKWMEAVAFSLESQDDPKLRATMDALIDDVLAAQEPSGYLNTYWVEERKPDRFKKMTSGHELYCLGHMLQAGIAYYRATGNRRLLDGGIKFVEYLLRDFGPDKRPLLAGHPEIEMALIELYRTTGDRRYLDLAGYILRGDGKRLGLQPWDLVYLFSGKPFTDRKIMEGHAVRACYAACGATDYYLETGDQAYLQTLETLWTDMTRGKLYLTGGVGSRAAGEAFGEPFELPNSQAYTESCAAIANMMWNWRMLAGTGDAKYADLIERALYNGVNAGMSLEGTLYCYRNPLELSGDPEDKIRNPWYDTTCCPPNLERTFAALPGYFYGTSKEGLYVHLYDNNEMRWQLEDGTPLRVTQKTKYPWEGAVEISVEPAREREFTLFLRIPAWSRRTEVVVNGEKAAGVPAPGQYLALRRTWHNGDKVRVAFDMDVQLVASNPLVKENTGRAAVERGPLVYCLEQIDQPLGTSLPDVAFKLSPEASQAFVPEVREGFLGSVTVLRHRGLLSTKPAAQMPLYEPFETLRKGPKAPGKPVDLVLIPYYSFANRQITAMQVWTPYRE